MRSQLQKEMAVKFLQMPFFYFWRKWTLQYLQCSRFWRQSCALLCSISFIPCIFLPLWFPGVHRMTYKLVKTECRLLRRLLHSRGFSEVSKITSRNVWVCCGLLWTSGRFFFFFVDTADCSTLISFDRGKVLWVKCRENFEKKKKLHSQIWIRWQRLAKTKVAGGNISAKCATHMSQYWSRSHHFCGGGFAWDVITCDFCSGEALLPLVRIQLGGIFFQTEQFACLSPCVRVPSRVCLHKCISSFIDLWKGNLLHSVDCCVIVCVCFLRHFPTEVALAALIVRAGSSFLITRNPRRIWPNARLHNATLCCHVKKRLGYLHLFLSIFLLP